MTRCSKCEAEPRYPGQRWGPRCMIAYTAARRRQLASQEGARVSRTEIPPAEDSPPLSLRPAALPETVLGLLGPEDQQTYKSYVLAQPASTDMLRHLLRFGLETVRTRGWVR